MSHYIPKNKKDENDILKTLEINSFEELVSIIPSNLRVKDGILGLEKGISEYELTSYIDSISRNHNNNHSICYSGGGVYDHFVPKVIDFISSRSEFNTAYTPYPVSYTHLRAHET